jgi:hypothetical protein
MGPDGEAGGGEVGVPVVEGHGVDGGPVDGEGEVTGRRARSGGGGAIGYGAGRGGATGCRATGCGGGGDGGGEGDRLPEDRVGRGAQDGRGR